MPPTIRLRNDIPVLGFKSPAEADEWFENNIEASDDCVSVDKLTVEIGTATAVGGIDIRLFERTVTV